MKKGDKGLDVKKLQTDLTNLGYSLGNSDGDFGVKTEAAVTQFQKDNKLSVDGTVTENVLAMIAKKLKEGGNTIVLGTIGGVTIYKNNKFIWFTAGMMIDCDGSPRAYGPVGTQALDYLANAGYPGNWWGVATTPPQGKGTPYIQKSNDPYPGLYISTTSLQYSQYPVWDTKRYVNSETIAGYVLPPKALKEWGLKLGQKAIITNKQNGKSCEAILFDIGPTTKIGEASMKCADLLGIPSNPKTGGIETKIIEYKILL